MTLEMCSFLRKTSVWVLLIVNPSIFETLAQLVQEKSSSILEVNMQDDLSSSRPMRDPTQTSRKDKSERINVGDSATEAVGFQDANLSFADIENGYTEDSRHHHIKVRRVQEDCGDGELVRFETMIYATLYGITGELEEAEIRRVYQQTFKNLINQSTEPEFACLNVFEVAILRQEFFDGTDGIARRRLGEGTKEEEGSEADAGKDQRQLLRARSRSLKRLFITKRIRGECRRCSNESVRRKFELLEETVNRRDRFLRLSEFVEKFRQALIATGYEIFQCMAFGEIVITTLYPRCRKVNR